MAGCVERADQVARAVLAIGVDYFPFRHINEKNYWHSVLPLLAARLGATIPVLSVNRRAAPVEWQTEGSAGVVIHNLLPARLLGAPKGEGYEATAYLHRFPLGPLRRSLTLQRRLPQIDTIVQDYSVGAIHFMDNFGGAMGLLKRRYPELIVTASLPTWMDRLGRLRRVYHFIRRRSFAGLDAVVTPAAATARQMIAAGFPASQVRVIPWGVVPGGGPSAGARQQAREKLAIPPEALVLLWSGFTQRSTAADLAFAVRVSQEARRLDSRVWAVFAFKPADLRPEYEALAGETTRVLRTSQTTFRDVLGAADLFVSPVTELGRTVTPPLTWLEALDAGLPVVTTPADGAADTLEDGRNGIIAATPTEAAQRIARVLADPLKLKDMQASARQLVTSQFNLGTIVEQYVQLWATRAGLEGP
jgi:glycosyltransferase involved in cell wall biosynthesis